MIISEWIKKESLPNHLIENLNTLLIGFNKEIYALGSEYLTQSIETNDQDSLEGILYIIHSKTIEGLSRDLSIKTEFLEVQKIITHFYGEWFGKN